MNQIIINSKQANVLDIKYEENAYLMDVATLTYGVYYVNQSLRTDVISVDEYNNLSPQDKTKYIQMSGWSPYIFDGVYKYGLPSYNAIENNTGMNLPVLNGKNNNQSPFDKLSLDVMFGTHIINKPLSFNKLKVITPISSYPYLNEMDGETYSINGALVGNGLNGISADETTITLDEQNVKFITTNSDEFSNTATERMLFSDGENCEYGEYISLDLYVYVPIRRSTSGFGYGYKKISDVKFFSQNSGNLVEISPSDVDSSSYVKLPSVGITDYAPLNNEGPNYPKTINDNKLVYYGSDGNNTNPVELTSYHYVGLTNNSSELTISDGYGEDYTMELNNFTEMPYTLSFYTGLKNKSIKYLSFNINELEDYNVNISVFKLSDIDCVTCRESHWINCQTYTDTLSNVYVVNTVTKGSGSKLCSGKRFYKEITYYSPMSLDDLNNNIYYVADTTMTIEASLYNSILNNHTTIHCKNETTKEQSKKGDLTSFWKIFGGFTNSSNVIIETSNAKNGDGIVRYITIESKVQGVYQYNKKERIIMQLQDANTTLPIFDENNVWYTVLSCGQKVQVVAKGSESSLNTSQQTTVVDGITYNYTFKTIHLSTTTGKQLNYPTIGNNSVFNLLDDDFSLYGNLLQPQNNNLLLPTENKYIKYVINNVDSVFVVAKLIPSNVSINNPLPTYIMYSPKYNLSLPVVNYEIHNGKVRLYISCDTTDNWYLQHYNFRFSITTTDSDTNENYTSGYYSTNNDGTLDDINHRYVFDITNDVINNVINNVDSSTNKLVDTYINVIDYTGIEYTNIIPKEVINQ